MARLSVPLPCGIRNFGVCTDATTGIERRRRRARALEGSRSEKNGEFWMTKTDFYTKEIVSTLQVPRLSRTPFA